MVPSIDADYLGEITAGWIDSYEWDTNTDQIERDSIVRIDNSTYFMGVRAGLDGDGYIDVFTIATDGTITKSITSWEFDTGNNVDGGVIYHIAEDLYACLYDDASNTVIFTFYAWNNGTVRNAKTDTDSTMNRYNPSIRMSKLHSETYAVFMKEQGGGFDYDLYTYKIFHSNGTINYKSVATVEDGATDYTDSQDMIAVDTDTVLCYYTYSDQARGNFRSVDVTVNGAISLVDNWAVCVNPGDEPTLCNLSNNYFALVYQGTDNDGYVATTACSDAGVLGDAWIDSLEYSTTDVFYTDIRHVKGDAYIITNQGVDGDGYAYTCLLYTSPSPRDRTRSRMPSSA